MPSFHFWMPPPILRPSYRNLYKGRHFRRVL
jgi:hypothetical protein